MGLWMKCPKCQTPNPLFLKACANCGHSLENLSPKERVYVLAAPGAAPPKPVGLLKDTPTPESPLPAKNPEPKAAVAVTPAPKETPAPAKAKKAKAPRKPRKKKS